MSRRGSALPSPSSDDTSVPPLEERWLALFGTDAPSRLPTLVAQAVAWREQVLAQGDVSPQVARDLKVAVADALRRRAVAGSEDGNAIPTSEVNEAYTGTGGTTLPGARSGQIRALRTRLAGKTLPLPPASSQLLPNTRLVKAHGGTNHVVEVEAAGFRYQGELFGSLSAVAKHITGTHWNGLLFFGLRKRGTYPAKARRHG